MKLFALSALLVFTLATTSASAQNKCADLKTSSKEASNKLSRSLGMSGSDFWSLISEASQDLVDATYAAEDCNCPGVEKALDDVSYYMKKLTEADADNWPVIKKYAGSAKTSAGTLSRMASDCN